MKKLLFLFSFLLAGVMAIAQPYTISVSGTVTDANGSPVENVQIIITSDSVPAGPSYFNTVYTDPNGNYSDTFPWGLSFGFVAVTMVNCPNMPSETQAFTWQGGNASFVADFGYCSNFSNCLVDIAIDSVFGTTLVTLTALPSGPPPYTFQWDNGETTQSITVPAEGSYCVAAADGDGCTAMNCVVFPETQGCWVYITADPAAGLTAWPQGAEPFAYQWSTGETTQSIMPNGYGEYCVSVTDADGCLAEACYWFGQDTFCFVFITYAELPDGSGYLLTANTNGPGPYVYQWDTGETTPEITVSTGGVYCVSVTDGNGCVAETCIYVQENGNCWVGISPDPSGSLTAWAQGTPPFDFLWNTGETAQTIFPNAFGEYCVTLTDATGCSAEACFWFFQDSLCSVYIVGQPLGGLLGYSLSAQPTGVAPFTFLWNTGEAAQTINVYEEGTYCVTVADSDGCTATACYAVQFQNQEDLIEGFVFAADSNGVAFPIEGKVYLIQYEPNAGLLTAVDSTNFSSDPGTIGGYYYFASVPAGSYLVKAFLTPGSAYYENYLPTYHFSHLYWDEADEVVIPYFGVNTFDINLIPGNNPGGPGFIGGLVSQGANIWGGGGEDRGVGDPMAGVSVLLLNDLEAPVTHALTQADGTFGFENLAWGSYKIVVEIPGLDQGNKWVTIGPENPSANVNFSVEEEGVVLEVNESGNEVESLVWPNPVGDQLSVYFFLESAAKGQLTLTSLDGRVRMTQSVDLQGGGQVLPVSVTGFPEGIYILQVATDGWIVSQRIVKE